MTNKHAAEKTSNKIPLKLHKNDNTLNEQTLFKWYRNYIKLSKIKHVNSKRCSNGIVITRNKDEEKNIELV